MIVGIGTDVVSIERVAALWQRFGSRWLQRLLHDEERQQLRRRFPDVEECCSDSSERRPPSDDVAAVRARGIEAWLARRFAAKEAASKALGTGIGHAAGLAEIAVLNDGAGRPELRFFGRAAATARVRGVLHAHLSLSDDAGIAQAFVVLEGRPDPEPEPDRNEHRRGR